METVIYDVRPNTASITNAYIRGRVAFACYIHTHKYTRSSVKNTVLVDLYRTLSSTTPIFNVQWKRQNKILTLCHSASLSKSFKPDCVR